jgi:hypothetical protein
MKQTMKRSFIWTQIFFLTTQLGAQVPKSAPEYGAEPTEEVTEFKPFMIEHTHEGCPGGSLCTKKTGATRKKWHDLLKEKPRRLEKLENFRKVHGIPLATWSRSVNPISDHLMLWNSPCPNHNKENEKIFLSEVIAKDFAQLQKLPHLIIRKTLLRDEKNKLIEYPVIRGEAPLYLSKGKMYYNLDTEGEYFTLSIDSLGNVQVVSPHRPANFPENVACPEDMLEAFKALPTPDDFYQGASCTSIWDLEARAYRTIILGWSCG